LYSLAFLNGREFRSENLQNIVPNTDSVLHIYRMENDVVLEMHDMNNGSVVDGFDSQPANATNDAHKPNDRERGKASVSTSFDPVYIKFVQTLN